MNFSYQYRIYPTNAQEKALDEQIEAHRKVYNKALEDRIFCKRSGLQVPNYGVQAKSLKIWRKETPNGAKCNYSSLQQTLRRLDKAWNRIYKKIGKQPRFKPISRWHSIEFSVLSNGWGIKENKLRIQNVGLVKVKWHRELPVNPSRLTVTRRNGKYYATFAVEFDPEVQLGLGEVGVDWGVKNVASVSDGRIFCQPRPLKADLKKIKKLSKKFSATPCEKTRKKLSRLHERVGRRRKDFNHKVAREIVRGNCAIALENFKVSELPKKYQHIRRAYADAGIAQLQNFVKYKAESAGLHVEWVDPSYTSQTCFSCGARKKLSLSERVYRCECGYCEDRDINAAKNILAVGLHGAIEYWNSPRQSCLGNSH